MDQVSDAADSTGTLAELIGSVSVSADEDASFVKGKGELISPHPMKLLTDAPDTTKS
jgi:hypothetical protein